MIASGNALHVGFGAPEVDDHRRRTVAREDEGGLFQAEHFVRAAGGDPRDVDRGLGFAGRGARDREECVAWCHRARLDCHAVGEVLVQLVREVGEDR